MSEDWGAISADAADAIVSVGFEVTMTRPASDAATPWDEETGSPESFMITVVDTGIKTKYSRADDGALVPRTVRTLLVSADGETPKMGDVITIDGRDHEVTAVLPIAPGGEAVMYKVELAI